MIKIEHVVPLVSVTKPAWIWVGDYVFGGSPTQWFSQLRAN